MATWYVDPDATGAGNGTDYANAYTHLQTAIAAKAANLTGAGPITFLCRSLHGTADTTALVIDGYTTTAADYIEIKGDPNETTGRHAGVWDTAKYHLVVSGDHALLTYEDYVRIDGLQIQTVTPGANGKCVFYLPDGLGASATIYITNCIIRGADEGTYWQYLVWSYASTLYFWNNIIYDRGTLADTHLIRIQPTTATAYLYSNSGHVGTNGYGIRTVLGTIVSKNNVISCGAGGVCYDNAAGSLTNTNCASSDLTADDFGGSGNITSVAYNTDTFINVSAGTEDFHLAADGLSPLQGVGTDTTGDAAPLNFTTDIDGQTRDATWDIGADAWYVEAGTTPLTITIPTEVFHAG